mmetsp:Transcript_3335/g.9585  ORF Transcript_3335/g.9585 Transcript_3335/m.9585 type:complete len:479 (+) Transcript_3335:235-1671(+)
MRDLSLDEAGVPITSLMDLDDDCLREVLRSLDSPETAFRLASCCRRISSLLADDGHVPSGGGSRRQEKIAATEAAGSLSHVIWEHVAQRMWPGSSLQYVPYRNWREMCCDDNSYSGAAFVTVPVPAGFCQWPADPQDPYSPCEVLIRLAGHTFQVSAGILFQQRQPGSRSKGSFGISLELVDEQVSSFPVHVMATIEQGSPASEEQAAACSPHGSPASSTVHSGHHRGVACSNNMSFYSAFCHYTSAHRMLLFKNCVSCGDLLSPTSGYLHNQDGSVAGPNDIREAYSGGPQPVIRVRIEIVRGWEKLKPETHRRSSTVLDCQHSGFASLGSAPQASVDAVVRRCWSKISKVKEIAWRYLHNTITYTARRCSAEQAVASYASLARAGVVKLLVALCCDHSQQERTVLESFELLHFLADSDEAIQHIVSSDSLSRLLAVNQRTQFSNVRHRAAEAIARIALQLDDPDSALGIVRRIKVL